MKIAVDGDIDNLERFKAALTGGQEAVLKLQSGLRQLYETGQLTEEEFNRLSIALEISRGQELAFGDAVRATGEVMERQNMIQSITGMVMGIGQLAFAVQGFKELGSI